MILHKSLFFGLVIFSTLLITPLHHAGAQGQQALSRQAQAQPSDEAVCSGTWNGRGALRSSTAPELCFLGTKLT